MTSLLSDIQRRFSIAILDIGLGARPQQQPHGLALILNDAVVQRRVALPRPPIQ